MGCREIILQGKCEKGKGVKGKGMEDIEKGRRIRLIKDVGGLYYNNIQGIIEDFDAMGNLLVKWDNEEEREGPPIVFYNDTWEYID